MVRDLLRSLQEPLAQDYGWCQRVRCFRDIPRGDLPVERLVIDRINTPAIQPFCRLNAVTRPPIVYDVAELVSRAVLRNRC